MQVLQVKPNDCHRVWPDVERYIVSAIESGSSGGSPICNHHHVRADVAAGRQLMFVALDEGKIHGCATVSIINNPLACCAMITALGGKMVVNEETFAALCSLLKMYGVTRVQSCVQPSTARLYKKVGLAVVAEIAEMEI